MGFGLLCFYGMRIPSGRVPCYATTLCPGQWSFQALTLVCVAGPAATIPGPVLLNKKARLTWT